MTGIKSWDVSNVKNMDRMFKNSINFSNDLSQWTVAQFNGVRPTEFSDGVPEGQMIEPIWKPETELPEGPEVPVDPTDPPEEKPEEPEVTDPEEKPEEPGETDPEVPEVDPPIDPEEPETEVPGETDPEVDPETPVDPPEEKPEEPEEKPETPVDPPEENPTDPETPETNPPGETDPEEKPEEPGTKPEEKPEEKVDDYICPCNGNTLIDFPVGDGFDLMNFRAEARIACFEKQPSVMKPKDNDK